MSTEPEACLDDYTEDLFDSIDACFFTGDTFLEEAAMKRAEWYMGRWQRAITAQRLENSPDICETCGVPMPLLEGAAHWSGCPQSPHYGVD